MSPAAEPGSPRGLADKAGEPVTFTLAVTMDKRARHQKILEQQLKGKGYVAYLFNRGEQVKYFDGTVWVEGEVTWSWVEPKDPSGLPNAIPPIHIDTESLFIANPPELRRDLLRKEKEAIANKIRDAFIQQGTDAIVE